MTGDVHIDVPEVPKQAGTDPAESSARSGLDGHNADVERLYALNRAIEDHPDAPSNYILRGEIFLSRREYHLAQADFQRALELAEAQSETAGWGIIAQVVAGRAQMGLQRAERYLGTSSAEY